jgi:predicted nucleic acid-binding Zn ribbon protein
MPGRGSMRKVGELLSAFFDEKMMAQAQGYSKLFLSWARLTKKYGIAAAADHSRIRELDRNVLIVEADHPGWIQILQTKEHKLLEELRSQFPDLDINGISFRLSRAPFPEAEGERDGPEEAGVSGAEPLPEDTPGEEKKPGYEGIKDERLKESLKSLEKSIAARNRGRK